MSRNIVREYINFDRESIAKYINIITEKKLNSKICDEILDIYVNIRYYDMYEHVKRNTIDDICFYVEDSFTKKYSGKNKEKNLPLVHSALIILRYVFLLEKYSNDKNISKLLEKYEEKLKEEYENTKVLVNDLIKDIKSDIHKKDKFINSTASNEFNVVIKDTNLTGVYDTYFDNCVRIPDLFSNVAINRVYNSGVINEDKMLVFYILTERQIIIDMRSYDYGKVYLIDFAIDLFSKRNKLNNLLRIFDIDYLKERMVLKVTYQEYLDNKDAIDELIHIGYAFAIILDSDYKDNSVLLDIFSYIIDDGVNPSLLKKYKNVICLR